MGLVAWGDVVEVTASFAYLETECPAATIAPIFAKISKISYIFESILLCRWR